MNGSGMSGAGTRRSGAAYRRRALAAAVALAGALLATTATPVRTTEAAWVEADAGTGAFTATQLASPVIVSCTATGLLGIGAKATIVWRFPAGTRPDGAAYAYPANAKFWFANSSLLSDLGLITANYSTTGPSSGQYTTTIDAGLLGNLLGGKAIVGVSTAYGSNWVSTPVTRTATWELLNNSCV